MNTHTSHFQKNGFNLISRKLLATRKQLKIYQIRITPHSHKLWGIYVIQGLFRADK